MPEQLTLIGILESIKEIQEQKNGNFFFAYMPPENFRKYIEIMQKPDPQKE